MSCKCYCALFSLCLIVGIGITGYIFRDQIMNEYYKFRSVKNSYEDDATEFSTKFGDLSTDKITTTKSVITSTSKRVLESDESNSSDERDISEPPSTTIMNILNKTTTTESSTTTSKPVTSSTFKTETVTDGSGFDSEHNLPKSHIHHQTITDDEDYDDDFIEGSGNL